MADRGDQEGPTSDLTLNRTNSQVNSALVSPSYPKDKMNLYQLPLVTQSVNIINNDRYEQPPSEPYVQTDNEPSFKSPMSSTTNAQVNQTGENTSAEQTTKTAYLKRNSYQPQGAHDHQTNSERDGNTFSQTIKQQQRQRSQYGNPNNRQQAQNFNVVIGQGGNEQSSSSIRNTAAGLTAKKQSRQKSSQIISTLLQTNNSLAESAFPAKANKQAAQYQYQNRQNKNDLDHLIQGASGENFFTSSTKHDQTFILHSDQQLQTSSFQQPKQQKLQYIGTTTETDKKKNDQDADQERSVKQLSQQSSLDYVNGSVLEPKPKYLDQCSRLRDQQSPTVRRLNSRQERLLRQSEQKKKLQVLKQTNMSLDLDFNGSNQARNQQHRTNTTHYLMNASDEISCSSKMMNQQALAESKQQLCNGQNSKKQSKQQKLAASYDFPFTKKSYLALKQKNQDNFVAINKAKASTCTFLTQQVRQLSRHQQSVEKSAQQSIQEDFDDKVNGFNQQQKQFDQRSQEPSLNKDLIREDVLAKSQNFKIDKGNAFNATMSSTRHFQAKSTQMRRRNRNLATDRLKFGSTTQTDLSKNLKAKKASCTFREEMARQNIHTDFDKTAQQSTSAGGFYSSVRDGSDGWTVGRKTTTAISRIQNETKLSYEANMLIMSKRSQNHQQQQRISRYSSALPMRPPQQQPFVSEDDQDVISFEVLQRNMTKQKDLLKKEAQIKKAYTKYFNVNTFYQSTAAGTTNSSRKNPTNRTKHRTATTLSDYQLTQGEMSIQYPIKDMVQHQKIYPPRRDPEDLSDPSYMNQSYEIVIGGQNTGSQEYFSGCEQRAHDLCNELAQVSQDVSSLVKNGEQLKLQTQKLKQKRRQNQKQLKTRDERVSNFFTQQNHRKVSQGIVNLHKEQIHAINVVKAARASRNLTSELKSKLNATALLTEEQQDEKVRDVILRESRKSILTDAYPKHYEGYSHWQHFITKGYYEKYVPKAKTLYELCQVKDAEIMPHRRLKGASSLQIKDYMQEQQKFLSQQIIDEKPPQAESQVSKWLRNNSKNFGRMSPDLVRELSQLAFVIPKSSGGGQFNQGQTIICKGVKPRMIYIVLQGSVRSCTLLEREEIVKNHPRGQAKRLSKTTYDQNEDLNDRVKEEIEDEDEGVLEVQANSPVSSLNADISENEEGQFIYDKQKPHQVLEVGAIFGKKETANGHVMLSDYVADQKMTQVLCVNGFDYAITVDKHLITERQQVARSLKQLKTLDHWTQTKLESLSQNFKIKYHRKGEVIYEEGADVNNIILVRQGKLRLQKNLTFVKQNVYPEPHKPGMRQMWNLQKTINEQELTILKIDTGTLVGVQEVYSNISFNEGTLIVDEDETILCYINKAVFMSQVGESDITALLRSSDDTVTYPKDEQILVKQKGDHELKQLRSHFLLDATGRNQEPLNSRPFDQAIINQSPKKVLHTWTNQFSKNLKPKTKIQHKPMAKYLLDQKEKARDKELNQILESQPLLAKQDCKIINDDRNYAMTPDSVQEQMFTKPTERSLTENHDDQTIFIGKSDWQIQAPGFVTGQERRLEKLQTEMHQNLVNMQTQGLTQVQKTMVINQLKLEAQKALKTHEIAFNVPQVNVTYQDELVNKIDYLDGSKKLQVIDGKIAGYIMDEMQDSLNYTNNFSKNEKKLVDEQN